MIHRGAWPATGREVSSGDPMKPLLEIRNLQVHYHTPRGPVKADRKAALAAGDLLETPEEARERVARGGPKPEHYEPTPPTGDDSGDGERVANPYTQDPAPGRQRR